MTDGARSMTLPDRLRLIAVELILEGWTPRQVAPIYEAAVRLVEHSEGPGRREFERSALWANGIVQTESSAKCCPR